MYAATDFLGHGIGQPKHHEPCVQSQSPPQPRNPSGPASGAAGGAGAAPTPAPSWRCSHCDNCPGGRRHPAPAVAQVVPQLRAQRPLHRRLGQPGQQPFLTQPILRPRVMLRQPGVNLRHQRRTPFPCPLIKCREFGRFRRRSFDLVFAQVLLSRSVFENSGGTAA